MTSRRRPLQPVLTWDEHDRMHEWHPLSASESGRYVLDETDTPGVRVCARCHRLVQVPPSQQ